MKTEGLASISAVLLIVFLLSASLFAGNNPEKVHNATKSELVSQSLLDGICSGNCGLAASAAYYLGELKESRAVIPLMRILKCSEIEGTRIAAALALTKIGDARGTFAVKQASRFDDSKYVRRMCKIFSLYTESLSKK